MSPYEIESYMKLHSFCLISGEGGIGKSFFIKCFEEKLAENGIEHLCVYGKFEKDANKIEVDQILNASERGFIFVFDAINEMSEEGQRNLLNKVIELKKNPHIRVVMTYRTNSMDATILEEYQQVAEYEYRFTGVSFESALSEMLKVPVPDVYLYEDILYSNNALMLNMLSVILSDKKIVEQKENGIASVTFILERYIEKIIGKIINKGVTFTGFDVWNDTKKIADWMYKNGEKIIDEKSLLSIIQTGDFYLSSMRQMGFIDVYSRGDELYYYFVIDSLSDFLIARSLFDDICELEYEEQISIIKSKVESLYNLEDAFIILLFDKFSPNYEYIKKVLKDTKLFERLDSRLLTKIHFHKDEIKQFQIIFESVGKGELLTDLGGFTDKPFNCSNYMFEYYSEKKESIIELSIELSGYYDKNELKNRLKNVLYFVTLNDRSDKRDEEAYYFSLLCSSAPNKDIRMLATKLLYEIVSKDEGYLEKIISDYEKIEDFYIQETILYVLSQIKHKAMRIKEFFNEIIISKKSISSKSIRRISGYFDEPYSYIKWDRDNKYVNIDNYEISDYLNKVLLNVDMYNKDYMPFRYWGKNHIQKFSKFLINDKREIERINNYLLNKYDCVNGGECSGLVAFEEEIRSEIKSLANIETMNDLSFFANFEKEIKYVFMYYGKEEAGESVSMSQEDFQNSLYMKCVDISTGLFYGNLMCNYYIDSFATFNNTQNSIGYEVYDPLQYGEDMCITAPIPTHQGFIEQLDDYIINRLEMSSTHKIRWLKNYKSTRKNILHLLDPIQINNQEWILLAGRVYLHEKRPYGLNWSDSYDIWCCSSDVETIKDDGRARYLTIELEEYCDELKAYSHNRQKPWLCKRVKNINLQSDVFEETTLVLPPSEIIKFFGLELNVSDLSWENSDKEKIIVCNNNKNSYYEDLIGGTVFMRRDYYDMFLLSNTIKYFSFSERYSHVIKPFIEISLHFEIENGRIVKEINNIERLTCWDEPSNPMCSNCTKFHFQKEIK